MQTTCTRCVGTFSKSVTLPDSLQVVGSCAFYNCRKLRLLTVGTGSLTMGSDVFLNCFALETILTAILFSMIGYFNGSGKTVFVMAQGLFQTLLVRLPMAYIMSIQPNASLTMIGLAAPTSTAVGALLNVCFFLYLNRKEKKQG